MLDFVNNILKKFVGSKADRDLKELSPFVPRVNDVYSTLSGISNDELRSYTDRFRERIRNHIAKVEKEIITLNEEAEQNPEMDAAEKEQLFTRIDALKKDRNSLNEEVLNEIHGEAFAVVKEAARRYKENAELEVTPAQHDRDLAARKANVIIRNDKAYYQNSWMAAGNMVTWDMVHYDAQLIGGTVLHQG